MSTGHFNLESFEVVGLSGPDLSTHLLLAPLCQAVELLVDVHDDARGVLMLTRKQCLCSDVQVGLLEPVVGSGVLWCQ